MRYTCDCTKLEAKIRAFVLLDLNLYFYFFELGLDKILNMDSRHKAELVRFKVVIEVLELNISFFGYEIYVWS